MEQENQALIRYDEIAVKHNAAYAAFQTIHIAKYPQPVKAEIKKDLVGFILGIILSVVMAASVIVSSSRTIDEFGGGVIGAIAFVMIEGGIMVYAFWRARRTINIKKVENALKLATFGLVMTFIVALSANIDATLRHKDIHLPDWVNTSINLFVAISAPVLAFISSEVLAIELMATDVRRRQADKEHLENMRVWYEGMNAAWAREKSRWGVRVEVEQPKQIRAENTVKSSKLQENTRFTPSRKLQQALDYFEVHPEELTIESRKLVEKVGVSHTTINKAQRMIRNGGDV